MTFLYQFSALKIEIKHVPKDCHSCRRPMGASGPVGGSRACPALDAGNPGSLNTRSLFSQGQAWIPVFTGMTDKVDH
jgi:hypothetical protein